MFYEKIKNIGLKRKNTEFPFFKDNPKLFRNKWISLIIGSAVLFLCSFSFGDDDLSTIIVISTSILIPLYAFKGHWQEIFKKPEKNDIWIIIFCLICDTVLTLTLSILLGDIGISGADNSWLNYNVIDLIFVCIQLLWEELLRYIPFIAALYLSYKYTSKRDLSVTIGTITCLIIFGLMHTSTYGNVIYALITIGFGSIFLAYSYIRTKNLFVTYILHLVIDFTIFILEIIGI